MSTKGTASSHLAWESIMINRYRGFMWFSVVGCSKGPTMSMWTLANLWLGLGRCLIFLLQCWPILLCWQFRHSSHHCLTSLLMSFQKYLVFTSLNDALMPEWQRSSHIKETRVLCLYYTRKWQRKTHVLQRNNVRIFNLNIRKFTLTSVILRTNYIKNNIFTYNERCKYYF